jgi:hypothetical protein
MWRSSFVRGDVVSFSMLDFWGACQRVIQTDDYSMEMDSEPAEEVGQGLMLAGSAPASGPPFGTLRRSFHCDRPLLFGMVPRCLGASLKLFVDLMRLVGSVVAMPRSAHTAC